MSKLFGSQGPRRPHLVRPGGGLKGEIADLRSDINAVFENMESSGGYIRTDEYIDPPAADPNAFKESIATAAVDRVFEGADLDGVIGGDLLVPARNLTVTSTTHAHVTAVDVVFHGVVLVNGKEVPRSVTLTLTAGGNTTDVSPHVLSRVDRIEVPAQGGTSGALQFGFGDVLGLSETIKTRGGLTIPVQQIAAGAVVVSGTFANPTGSPVGTYAPAAAPNGANDYAVTYVVA